MNWRAREKGGRSPVVAWQLAPSACSLASVCSPYWSESSFFFGLALQGTQRERGKCNVKSVWEWKWKKTVGNSFAKQRKVYVGPKDVYFLSFYFNWKTNVRACLVDFSVGKTAKRVSSRRWQSVLKIQTNKNKTPKIKISEQLIQCFHFVLFFF